MERIDKRKDDQLRKINIQRNFNKYAEGSCLIEMGNTKVICTGTVEQSVPVFLRNTGEGWLTAEYRMLPRATHIRTLRDRPSGRNMEIQRLIGRSLRSIIDLKKIGERTIRIDCDVIQADGGTRVASIVGGFIALVDCVNYLKRRGELHKLYVTDYLGAISVGIWRKSHILDLRYEEDSEVDVDFNIVMKGNGEFVEMQGTAERGTFSETDLTSLLELGRKGIEKIIEIEKSILKDVITEL